jgi:transcriptional regulator with XRE-family HTH domain
MDRLAELREKRGLTLRELSGMSGVSPDTINQIELGHRRPRPSTLRKLARALDIDIADFFREPALSGKAEASATGPQSLEWALTAPAEEYSEWILNAASLELHKTWISLTHHAEALENGERHRYVIGRAQEAIDQYFRLNPASAVRPRKSQVSADDENQESREVG